MPVLSFFNFKKSQKNISNGPEIALSPPPQISATKSFYYLLGFSRTGKRFPMDLTDGKISNKSLFEGKKLTDNSLCSSNADLQSGKKDFGKAMWVHVEHHFSRWIINPTIKWLFQNLFTILQAHIRATQRAVDQLIWMKIHRDMLNLVNLSGYSNSRSC